MTSGKGSATTDDIMEEREEKNSQSTLLGKLLEETTEKIFSEEYSRERHLPFLQPDFLITKGAATGFAAGIEYKTEVSLTEKVTENFTEYREELIGNTNTINRFYTEELKYSTANALTEHSAEIIEATSYLNEFNV